MAVHITNTDRYTADPVYQWDTNQTIEIYGLSLDRIPVIHFSNEAMARAIARTATVDAAGVIRAEIPNSLLQANYKMSVHICVYYGDSFETLYTITIPVIGRKRPADYTLTLDDDEVYSFNALEAKLDETIDEAKKTYKATDDKYNALNTKYEALLVHLPRINPSTGYWQEWNYETGAYEDTSILAGQDGYTPVRGTDYWTDADIATIKAYVDDSIINGKW